MTERVFDDRFMAEGARKPPYVAGSRYLVNGVRINKLIQQVLKNWSGPTADVNNNVCLSPRKCYSRRKSHEPLQERAERWSLF